MKQGELYKRFQPFVKLKGFSLLSKSRSKVCKSWGGMHVCQCVKYVYSIYDLLVLMSCYFLVFWVEEQILKQQSEFTLLIHFLQWIANDPDDIQCTHMQVKHMCTYGNHLSFLVNIKTKELLSLIISLPIVLYIYINIYLFTTVIKDTSKLLG